STRVYSALLADLYERLDETRGRAAPSQPHLARTTGLSRRAVRDVLERFVAAGAVKAIVRRGLSTQYELAHGVKKRHGVKTRHVDVENAPSPWREDAPSTWRAGAPSREEGRNKELFEEAREVKTASDGLVRLSGLVGHQTGLVGDEPTRAES